MTEEINEDSTLPQVFSAAKKLMDAVRQSKEVGNSERAQEDLEKAIQLLERCSKMVSSLQLFSKNESVDEISTSSLPYILLPAYLAEMTNLQKVSSAADREPIVETVVIYYEDFLQRCLDYELFDGPIPKQFALTSATSSLQDQMKSRQDKIQKYIQRRENETKLQAFRELQISSAVIDEETTREINLLSIKVAIDDACENLTHFLQEKSLLSQRDGWPEHPSEYYSESTRPETNSLTRPAVLILTRDQIEKSVFGTGFPSVPTMTLDEWYESQCQHASGTGLPESPEEESPNLSTASCLGGSAGKDEGFLESGGCVDLCVECSVTVIDCCYVSCSICNTYSIHVNCLGMNPMNARNGQVSWKCMKCPKLNVNSLLKMFYVKLEKLESDVGDLKSTRRDKLPQTDSGKSYLQATMNSMLPAENAARSVFNRNNKPRTTSISSQDSSGSKKRKLQVNKVVVITGSATVAEGSQVKGIAPAPRQPPRRHYFISPLSQETTVDDLLQHCREKNLQPIGCRSLPSRRQDMKSFHIVLPESVSDLAESGDTWPENCILRRYYINEEARSWLKSIQPVNAS